MKIAIDNPIRNISPNIASHRSSWAYLWREMLLEDGHECRVLHDAEDWDDGYDQILVYWGLEFNGSPNMFDGLSPVVFDRMDRFVQNRERMRYVSLEHQIKDLFLRRMRVRIGNKTTDERATKEWIETLFGVFSNLETTDQHDLKPRRSLVIGDSHTISVWRPGSYIKRMDGKTLRGLSKTLLEDAAEFTSRYPLDFVTIYAGNIDIRHHLFRHHDGFSGPEDYLEDTLGKFVDKVRALRIPQVELVHALPIEHESRYLRQSVCLEGSPFTGSWEDRTRIMHHFNRRIDEIAAAEGWSVYRWPQEWYERTEQDPKWFFNVMEKPYSVHLSREFYRWKTTYQDPPRSSKKKYPKRAGDPAPKQSMVEDIWE